MNTSTWSRRALLLLALSLHALWSHAALLVAGEPRSFAFTPPGRFADKPVTVHYYKPKNTSADAALLFAMHGAERSGSGARDTWMRAADKYGFIVVAPEFDYARYPNDLYQLGGMQSRDPADWTFQIIESLFDAIRGEEGLKARTYLIFGHSAGAQFVHRFVLMMDHARVSTAIAANAGAYTIPAYPASLFDLRYPWALDENLFDRYKLEAVFRRRLVIMLGEDDTQSDSEGLPRSREAMAQGSNRFERGKNFFAKAKAQAEASGVPLNWRMVTVPGVGHSSGKMGKAALSVLFD
ncbi:hypothetical protein EGT07_02360 [Herbaspirillum sp. HC18]|nr:hypothetical protein EGT07_02360 [Herbaspirillum sp. HC18]